MSPAGTGRVGRPTGKARNSPIVIPARDPSERDDGVHGHALSLPEQDHLRLLFANIGGLPQKGCRRSCGSCKDCQIRSLVTEHRIDILGLSEINVNWRWVPVQHRPQHRTGGWFERCRTVSAYHSTYEGHKNPQLYGGTSVWSINKAATRVDGTSSICDSLGRWSGQCFRGRNNTLLYVIAAYRPRINRDGPESVWSQQYAYWVSREGQCTCPRDRFDSDLQDLIRQLSQEGTQIVLGIDANEDLRNTDEDSFRRKMQSVGLEEVIAAQHGLGPATTITGSVPIDGIFVTTGLQGCRCGYVGWISDHTGLYLDVSLEQALGHVLPPIVKPVMRRLILSDPRVVARYLEHYRAQLYDQDALGRMDALWKKAQLHYDPTATASPLTAEEQAEFVELDRLCTAAMLSAERGCRKLFTGAVPWSPAYQTIQNHIHLLQMIQRQRAGHQISGRMLLRFARRSQFAEALAWTDRKITRQLHQLIDERKHFKASLAVAARQTHNERLVTALAESSGNDPVRIMKALMHREAAKARATTIRFALRPVLAGAVAMVETSDESGTTAWTTKEDMERVIQRECLARFHQASNTEFMRHPLLARVGTLGVTPFCDRVLAASVTDEDLSGVSEYAVKLIKQMARPDAVTTWNPVPELPLFQQRWRRQRERTSSFPGRHMAHLMASVRDDTLAEFHRQHEFLPVLTGSPPPSWLNAVDVLIEKKPGNFDVTKLRIICLFDCIANHCFKQMGKFMMSEAEAAGILAKEQGGSRKGHRANFIGLEKRLTFDISRQLRQPMALCSNDARSCYDRIVHSIASMCLQRAGMPKPAVVCIFTTIQNLEHYIRTVFGDSEGSFGVQQACDLYAVPVVSTIGQGNGAGPQIWALVSTPLLNVLRAEGFGMFFRCSLSQDRIHFVGYSFVDDTDLGICGEQWCTYQEVASQMQQALDHWEGGLSATGGALAPEKTFWYLIDYKFVAGAWKYKEAEECPASLTVKDMNGQEQTIRRCSLDHAERTLGVYLAPNGSETTQCGILRKQSTVWAKAVLQGRLPRHLALEAYRMTIDKTLSYPLVATCLSPNQAAKIQSPALTAALRLAGIGKDFPRALRFGPVAYQGLGLPDLFVTQLLAHLDALMFAAEAPHRNTSQLLRTSGELLKLELGVNGRLFDNDFRRLSRCSTKSWMRFTWEACYTFGVSIHDSYPDFVPNRIHDRLLMDIFLEAGIQADELATLNRCRMFLHAVFVSDISTGDGISITLAAWKGERDPSRSSPYTWPQQGTQTANAWILWRETLATTLCRSGRQLKQKLGAWLDSDETIRWYYSPSQDRVFERSDSGWRLYTHGYAGSHTRGRRFSVSDITPDRPADLMRATVYRHSATAIVLEGFAETITATVPAPRSLASFMRLNLPEDTAWILDNIQWPDDDGSAVALAIHEHKCIVVSDGSFEPVSSTGSAAMTIQGASSALAIFGQCASPGTKETQSAYRSELTGIYLATAMIHFVCRYHAVQQGTVTLGCDGLAALREATSSSEPIGLSAQQFDLISAIRRLLRETPVEWKSHHVLGHQRERGPNRDGNGAHFIGPLDRWASLNDDMDLAAKAFRAEYYSTDAWQPMFLFRESAAISVAGVKVSSRAKDALRHHINGTDLLAYWEQKRKFGESTSSCVDWLPLKKAMMSLSQARRLHQSKMVSSFVAVRRRMRLRQQVTDDSCPCCLAAEPPVASEESVTHLFTCPATQAVWNDRLESFDGWLESVNTAPAARVAIVESLRAWRLGLPLPRDPTEPDLQQLLDWQDAIGWQSAFEGRFVLGWADMQDRHYRLCQSKPYHTGKRWLSQVIQRLFDIAWDLWEHRNGILHHRETGLHITSLRQQVADEFQQGAGLSQRLRMLFRPGQDRIKRRSITQIEAWLYQVRVERQIAGPAERVLFQQQELMARFLGRRNQ